LLEAFPRCSGEQPHSQAHPQLADKLCPVTVIAHASSGPGKTAVIRPPQSLLLRSKHSILVKVSIDATINFSFTQAIEITT
jgi:hypothetical protein